MKEHKDALSRTSLKAFVANKYLKAERTKPVRDISSDYVVNKKGVWFRREKLLASIRGGMKNEK